MSLFNRLNIWDIAREAFSRFRDLDRISIFIGILQLLAYMFSVYDKNVRDVVNRPRQKAMGMGVGTPSACVGIWQ